MKDPSVRWSLSGVEKPLLPYHSFHYISLDTHTRANASPDAQRSAPSPSLPQRRDFSRSSPRGEHSPPHSPRGKLVVLLCMTMAPCPPFPSQLTDAPMCTLWEDILLPGFPRGNPSVTVTNVLSVSALGNSDKNALQSEKVIYCCG